MTSVTCSWGQGSEVKLHQCHVPGARDLRLNDIGVMYLGPGEVKWGGGAEVK